MAGAGPGAHRSPSLPLSFRRVAAVAAATGGALSLVGVTSSATPPGDGLADAATVLRISDDGEAEEEADTARPSIEPVAPEPEIADADDLVRSVLRAEETARAAAEEEREAAREKAAEERKKAREKAEQDRSVGARGSPDCGLNTSGLGAVRSHVRAAGEFLGCQFGKPKMHGVAGRGGPSDHPGGRAIDFMVNRATGDALAECALRNKDELGIIYVIWRQRINYGSGWKLMEDRGGVTANHFDHVHISFGSSGSFGGNAAAGRC